MTIPRFLIVFGLLTVAAASAEQAKTYRVTLPGGKIGATEIAAGDYSIAVQGSAVTLTELKTRKKLDVAAKVENMETKNFTTEIHSNEVDGVRQISEIRPAGAKVRIDLRGPATP